MSWCIVVCAVSLLLCFENLQAQPVGAGNNGNDGLRRNGCKSLADAIESYDFLSTFRSSLTATDMITTLMDKNLTITLLAPTNEVNYCLHYDETN
jgi:hypothetical protein